MAAASAAAALPNSGELAAASALVLLSFSSPAPPPPPPPPATLSDALSYSSSSASASASAASCVSDSTSRGRALDPLRVLAVVASLRRIDPKVLAKATSTLFEGEAAKKRKGVWIEDEGDESSTVTASASGGSTATSGKRGPGKLRRRADAIVDWLSLPDVAPATEMAIRRAVGDNPDTGKALRLLVKQGSGGGLRRAGTGCRGDPYVYMVVRHSEVNSH